MTALEHSRAASPDELLMLLFSDPAVRADPYPVYHQLREMAPVHRSEVFPLWVVSSFDGCGAVLREPVLGLDKDRRLQEKNAGDCQRAGFSRQ